MEDNELSERHKNLVKTVTSILSYLKMNDVQESKENKEDKENKEAKEDKEDKKDDISVQDLEKNINELQIEDEENEQKEKTQYDMEQEGQYLKHFSYFVKHLFLDGNGNFDFKVDTLKDIMGEQMAKDIFALLKKYIELKNFFGFIFELGELFVKKYFEISEKYSFEEIVNQFEYKGINNYECMFQIFSNCIMKFIYFFT